MAKTVIGKEALTVIQLDDGSRANIDRGVVVPANADRDDVKRLIDEGYLEVVEFEDVEAVPDPAQTDSNDQGSDLADLPDEELVKRGVGEVLDAVGDDADRAARLLELENSKGEKARPKLVKGLEEAIDAKAAADGSTGDGS